MVVFGVVQVEVLCQVVSVGCSKEVGYDFVYDCCDDVVDEDQDQCGDDVWEEFEEFGYYVVQWLDCGFLVESLEEGWQVEEQDYVEDEVIELVVCVDYFVFYFVRFDLMVNVVVEVGGVEVFGDGEVQE